MYFMVTSNETDTVQITYKILLRILPSAVLFLENSIIQKGCDEGS